MTVLMLSWEYPPRVVGGLARHVSELARALVRLGVRVHVVTCAAAGGARDGAEDDEGVTVHRVGVSGPPAPDFLTWVLHLNVDMLAAAALLTREVPYDLIHAHDWLVAHAARALKHSLRRPLVATIHATEYGRNGGLHTPTQRYIGDIEWWLSYEAWRVICCSDHMRQEIRRVFQVPDDKLDVIPNGVTASPPRAAGTAAGPRVVARRDFALPEERLVLFVGRLVHEKGVHVLLEAAPKVLHYWPRCKFVVCGQGPADAYLKDRARQLGIWDKVYFTGYLDDSSRDALYSFADVAVVPSLYEPFGITALEAMAAGTAVAVADVGGLSEVVRHGVTGWKFYAGSPNSLADALLHLLFHPDLARRLGRNAARQVRASYDWSMIGRRTCTVYERVLKESSRTPWADYAPSPSGSVTSVAGLPALGVTADGVTAADVTAAGVAAAGSAPGRYTLLGSDDGDDHDNDAGDARA